MEWRLYAGAAVLALVLVGCKVCGYHDGMYSDCPAVGDVGADAAIGDAAGDQGPCTGSGCCAGTPASCGALGACADCTANPVGHQCIGAACGCVTTADCVGTNVCDTTQHLCIVKPAPACGVHDNWNCCAPASSPCYSATCVDCTLSAQGHACLGTGAYGYCGCVSSHDCPTGTRCQQGYCAAPQPGVCVGMAWSCGPNGVCDDCTISPAGGACIGNDHCGCTIASDCPVGQACVGGVCGTGCSNLPPAAACNGGCCDGLHCSDGLSDANCGGSGGACVGCTGTYAHCVAGRLGKGECVDANQCSSGAASDRCVLASTQPMCFACPRSCAGATPSRCSCYAQNGTNYERGNIDCVGVPDGTACYNSYCGCTSVSDCPSSCHVCDATTHICCPT